MIRVVVLSDDKPYAEDYEAWLTGWVSYEGRIMALVVMQDGDTPWLVPLSLIQVKV